MNGMYTIESGTRELTETKTHESQRAYVLRILVPMEKAAKGWELPDACRDILSVSQTGP